MTFGITSDNVTLLIRDFVPRPVLECPVFSSMLEINIIKRAGRVGMLIWLILSSLACDSAVVNEFDDGDLLAPDTLRLSPREAAIIDNGIVAVTAQRWGALASIIWHDDTGVRKSTISTSSIWLAANQNGPKSVTPPFSVSSVHPAIWENDSTGYLTVTPDSLEYEIPDWPFSLGAPADEFGRPVVYGDQMSWGAFVPNGPPGVALEGLMYGMSTYIYEGPPLNSYVFQRFDITNTSSSVIDDLHIGVFADIDINAFGKFLGTECESLDHHTDQSGYDPAIDLAYVYKSRIAGEEAIAEYCYGDVYGFAILPMTIPNGIGADKLASRIVRRGGALSDLYQDYSESNLTTPETFLWALQGLSYDGSPMVDPTTNTQTKFAFSGDPVARTGWLDERHDVRNLVSLLPVTVSPGETVSLTIVWIFASGESLVDGFTRIKLKYSQVLARSDAWDF